MPTALITGGSRGLGRALAAELVGAGWRVVVDARDADALSRTARELGSSLVVVPGDVADPEHRRNLKEAVEDLGSLDLLVNNAGTLGASPLPGLDAYPIEALEHLFLVNVIAPLALTQLLLPHLRRTQGAIVNITSDAAVEAYEGWGGYGSSKAALDQIAAVMGAEEGSVRVYAFDPGDMRTLMQQEASPGEDISDRPEPETVVPAFMRLLDARPASGRYRAADLMAAAR